MSRFLFKKLDVCKIIILTISVNIINVSSLTILPIDRVIGGDNAKPGDYPAQISLRFGKIGHYCGGTLITLSDVLTAAHCLYYGPRILQAYGLVIAGEIRSEIEESKTLQKLRMKNVVIHPLYDCKTLENDIGLVKLDGAFVETKYVKPMPRASEKPSVGQSCEIIGWGSTDPTPNGEVAEVLQHAWVEIQTNFRCGSLFSKIPFEDEQMICAGALQERGICSGDSGGPLICDKKIVGIASAGFIPCAIKGYGGRFTAVAHYDKFVDVFLEWNGEGLPPMEKYSFKMLYSTGNMDKISALLLFQPFACKFFGLF